MLPPCPPFVVPLATRKAMVKVHVQPRRSCPAPASGAGWCGPGLAGLTRLVNFF